MQKSFSLFKVGLVAMLLFVLASNILNYVAIATNVWAEDTYPASLWSGCNTPGLSNSFRSQCFNANPPALIATGTALNCLSLVLILVAQLALFMPRFRDSFALYFVIGALITTLLSLLFSSIGWFFVFFPQYQALASSTSAITAMFKLGWSFWLMTPSFGCSILAALIGAAILGCTCVANKVVRQNPNPIVGNILRDTITVQQNYVPSGVENPNFISNQPVYYKNDPYDPQVLRL